MYPKQHILLGFLFSSALLYFFPNIGFIGFLTIFLSSFLIDIDHYLGYAYITGNFSPVKSVRWHYAMTEKVLAMPRKKRNEMLICFCFLHGIEILILLAVLGFLVSKIFLFVLIGFTFHLFLDLIYEPVIWDRFDKVSIIYDLLNTRKLTKVYNLNSKNKNTKSKKNKK